MKEVSAGPVKTLAAGMLKKFLVVSLDAERMHAMLKKQRTFFIIIGLK
jgi:hypothetical protein